MTKVRSSSTETNPAGPPRGVTSARPSRSALPMNTSDEQPTSARAMTVDLWCELLTGPPSTPNRWPRRSGRRAAKHSLWASRFTGRVAVGETVGRFAEELGGPYVANAGVVRDILAHKIADDGWGTVVGTCLKGALLVL
ncbi:hypothetical protein A7J05_03030 [Streptomyces alfalfae]|uniref:Uncharacterized protein n=2 Tax=Streptomyces alfalfae TaxID=1642299 RepID=A0ABM6GNI9_9ACTN|nr:hypothetical protein A7J05_03030 [Streptomyces alfalfae]